MSTYADVALPLAVDKTFTYLIPPELESTAVEGVRAIVPFGRKYATGVIVGHPQSSPVPTLKPMLDILDSSPLLSTELLQLCRWVADYYMAPLGEVLKTALPQGFSPASKRQVHPLFSGSLDTENLPPQRRKLLELILERGPSSVQDLKRRTGIRNINAILTEMARSGYLELREVLPRPKQVSRTREFVLLAEVNDETLASTLRTLPPRTKKAHALLQTVSDLKAGGLDMISVTDLAKKAGASSAVLKAFMETGLLPSARRQVAFEQDLGNEEQTLSITLNQDQQKIVTDICSAMATGQHQAFLIHGVTGSGKTQVYIEAIRDCVGRGSSAIVLVPEISLTPQIVRRFNSHFPGIVSVVHSKMSQGERIDVWRQALEGKYRIVIGPRSALFAPVQNLGLVVVDEEHESSYKQYDSVPRYHARDAALVRAKLCNAVAILGSATPSMESYYNAKAGKYTLLELPVRVDNIPMPGVTVIDMREERRREYRARKEEAARHPGAKWKVFQQGAVSATLRDKISYRISRREGIIVLQNRRGFAPFVECVECGYCETCEHCSVTLTYHLAKKHLRCHYCGTVYAPHTLCPQCRGETLQLRGIGTQRVEEELGKLFPDAAIVRMDLDTTSRKGAHGRILQKFGDGEADILLGTQMVAKGLDFPRVTLVGVISADTQMLLPDFRSAERTFQLLTQVAGRAGRSTLSGEVLIQTHQPDHYTLQHVLDHDFKAFYQEEITAREELEYPPFSRLVLIEFKGKNEGLVQKEAERFKNVLALSDGMFTLLGPSPAVIPKINEQFRWHIIVKSRRSQDPAGSHLRSVLRKVFGEYDQKRNKSVRVIVDVDPVGLM